MNFDIDHLPFGSVRAVDGRRFAAVRFGDDVLDLAHIDAALFASGTLDAFLASGRTTWRAVRQACVDALTADRFPLEPLAELTAVLPFTVADYVDFYASEQHATNVGHIFRPDGAALTPNWKHLPIGYHGRAGTVVVSGTDVRRPNGQTRNPDGTIRFGPSQRLDIEAEVAFVVGTGSELGTAVTVDEFRTHVFGLALLNDWSARDIQTWEYVPLGPFLGKSFATSVSAWVLPLAALEGARVAPPARELPLLPYLEDGDHWGLALDLTVEL
ncbi:MAG: fumarylacetoacetate hydrolase family protein, partial [Jatrophihabitantaceae bacterium]